MPLMVRAVLKPRAGNLTHVSYRMTGTQLFELSPLPPRVSTSRKRIRIWIWELNPGSLMWDTDILTAGLNILFQFSLPALVMSLESLICIG